MKRSNRQVLTVAVVGVLGFAADRAEAGFVLELQNGLSTATIADNSLLDNDLTVGKIEFIGAVGVFDVNVTTGISKPVSGTANLPILNLNSVNVSSTAGGTLAIRLTDTDFTGPLGPGVSSSLDFGGTTNGTAALDAFLDNTNAQFGTGIPVGSFGPFGAGAFSVRRSHPSC